jgi:hypothetical protein
MPLAKNPYGPLAPLANGTNAYTTQTKKARKFKNLKSQDNNCQKTKVFWQLLMKFYHKITGTNPK